MATVAPERTVGPALDIKVIDVDTHLSEPEDLWTSRAPAKFRDRVPQMTMVDGEPIWIIDGKHKIAAGSSSTFYKDGRPADGLEYVSWRLADVLASAYDTKERVKLIDQLGIHAQIIYPNVIGFGGQNTAKVDPELRLVSVQIYNDAMAELQEESGNRLYPIASLPWWDIKEAVRETERAHDAGQIGIAHV